MAKSMATAESLKQEMDPQDIERLRTLVPLRTLDDEAFARLLENAQLQTLRRDEVLFRQGDTEQVSYYLLDGSVAMLSGEHVVDMLNARSESARFPIAHLLPRKHTVRAAGAVKVALLDSRQVSQLLAEAHKVEYQVADVLEADSGDWMGLLLQSPLLQQLPAANIQRVMMNVDQVEVHAGERVIRQGDPGDYYYMLVKGNASAVEISEATFGG